MYCEIELNINKKNVITKVIIDTGNFLKEPITKTPVIVVEKNILESIIPKYILDNLNKIIIGENIDLKDIKKKLG